MLEITLSGDFFNKSWRSFGGDSFIMNCGKIFVNFCRIDLAIVVENWKNLRSKGLSNPVMSSLSLNRPFRLKLRTMRIHLPFLIGPRLVSTHSIVSKKSLQINCQIFHSPHVFVTSNQPRKQNYAKEKLFVLIESHKNPFVSFPIFYGYWKSM